MRDPDPKELRLREDQPVPKSLPLLLAGAPAELPRRTQIEVRLLAACCTPPRLRAVVGNVLPEARGLPFPPKHVALPCLSAGRHDPTVVARREAELLVWMKALLELEGARSVTALTGFLCR